MSEGPWSVVVSVEPVEGGEAVDWGADLDTEASVWCTWDSEVEARCAVGYALAV